jgi:dTMP kinase
MPTRGSLIAIEGIDGSGKRTQVDLLAKALQTRGHSVHSTGFPQYNSWFGRMAGQFLNGDFGDVNALDARLASLLYAGDRFEAKPQLEAALAAGQIVLADRYIASNLAHQGARVASDRRSEFIGWLKHLEYEIYGLPSESLVLYLRVPAVQAQQLVKLKASRSYTTAKHDILEANLRHLESAAEIYDDLAKQAPWATIQCFDTAANAMRPADEIASEVLAAVEPILAASAAKGAR